MIHNSTLDALVEKLRGELPAESGYEAGYRDALESMALALGALASPADLASAVQTALDAAANNAGTHLAEAATATQWERNEIQFPRLIAEINATQDNLDLAALAESMDLEVDDVKALFDRAEEAWNAIKEGSRPPRDRSAP